MPLETSVKCSRASALLCELSRAIETEGAEANRIQQLLSDIKASDMTHDEALSIATELYWSCPTVSVAAIGELLGCEIPNVHKTVLPGPEYMCIQCGDIFRQRSRTHGKRMVAAPELTYNKPSLSNQMRRDDIYRAKSCDACNRKSAEARDAELRESWEARERESALREPQRMAQRKANMERFRPLSDRLILACQDEWELAWVRWMINEAVHVLA